MQHPHLFDQKIQMDPNGGCWLWSGAQDTSGYGLALQYGKPKTTHRLMWERTNGPIPKGLCVCHKCDVRACVNPDHLFLGTVADNNADKDGKGRANHPLGEKCANAKLNPDLVREIRARVAAGEEHRPLGKEYGVAHSQIGRIARREIWAHVQ